MAYKRYKQGNFVPQNKDKYKGSFPITFRSSWELALCKYLDLCSACVSWGSESAVVHYMSPIDNQVHKYFIDFTAVFKDRENKLHKYYIEIKPARQLVQPKPSVKKQEKTFLKEQQDYIINTCKWKSAVEWAKTKGAKFVILTEKELFKQI